MRGGSRRRAPTRGGTPVWWQRRVSVTRFLDDRCRRPQDAASDLELPHVLVDAAVVRPPRLGQHRLAEDRGQLVQGVAAQHLDAADRPGFGAALVDGDGVDRVVGHCYQTVRVVSYELPA